MRLEALELLAYGSLSNVRFDFGASPALHVIYGNNEAGKSTALRALSGLFYGIPRDTPDAHTHGTTALRIGARLCDAHGVVRYVVRRKGNKATLRDENDQPLGPEVEAWMTAGVVEPLFNTFFGLSHRSLETLSFSLSESGGELGQTLFEAGLGGRSMQRLLAKLEAEADELYKPQGKKQAINQALAQLEERKRAVREATQDAEAFATQMRAVEAAERDVAEAEAQILALRAEQSRLQRAKGLIPLLNARRELDRERHELGVVVVFSPAQSEERRAAEQTARESREQARVLGEQIADLERKLSQQRLPASLAELPRATVDELREAASR